MKPPSSSPPTSGGPPSSSHPTDKPSGEPRPPSTPGAPSVGPAPPTLGPPPAVDPIKICIYWNPAAVPGYPWLVRREQFGEGCFTTGGQGWLQHISTISYPLTKQYKKAGWDPFTDYRNPYGRGNGDPDDEHMDAVQLWSAPAWLVYGFKEAMQIMTNEFPGRVIVYMGNLTGTDTAEGEGLSDQMFAELGPERWAEQVIYAWADILEAKCHIGVDVLYARNTPTDDMMTALLDKLAYRTSKYDGRVLGEPFNEMGSWHQITNTMSGKPMMGTYTAFRYWNRMTASQVQANRIDPTFVGDFGDTDGSLEEIAHFVAQRNNEGVVANISGSFLDKIDPAALLARVRELI